MYLEHYQLKAKPFDLSPRPDLLWLGEKHKEALAVLQYGIAENLGFVLLTGEVGVGKTALIYRLMSRLDAKTLVAHITDPGLETFDFFRVLAAQFNLDHNLGSKAEFLIQLEAFLRQAHAAGKKVLLIVDEAQRLNDQLLDQIRVLSNIELSHRKLINIFLVGQPELKKIIMADANRAVRQRIAISYHIDTLDETETAQYIAHRLNRAGAKAPIFKTDAIREIHRYAGGYPRLINIICDHALVTGYASDVRTINAETITECQQELSIAANTPTRGGVVPASPAPKKPSQMVATRPAHVISTTQDTLSPEVPSPPAESSASTVMSRRNPYFALIAIVIILGVFTGYHWLKSGSIAELPPFVQKFVRQDSHPPEHTSGKRNDTNGPDALETLAVPVIEIDQPEMPTPGKDSDTAETEHPSTMVAGKEPFAVTSPSASTEETAAPVPSAPAASPPGARTTAAADPPPPKPQPVTEARSPAPARETVADTSKEPQATRIAPDPVPTPIPDTDRVPTVQRTEPVRAPAPLPSIQTPEAARQDQVPPKSQIQPDTPRPPTPAATLAQAELTPPPAPEQPISRPLPSDREVADSDLKIRLENFLQAYCATYEAKNLDAFRKFFAADALENDQPFKSLLPTYERNFKHIEKIEYQIELQRFTYDTDQEWIDIEGQFSLKWLPPDNRWRQNGGTIAMRLSEKGSSFVVHRLDYHGGEPPKE